MTIIMVAFERAAEEAQPSRLVRLIKKLLRRNGNG